jgi:tetratricopeptide (TPR) repeat protein
MTSFTKHTILWLIALLLCAGSIQHLKAQSDSLYDELSSTDSDSIKIRCYLDLSRYYMNHQNTDSSIFFASKGIELSNKIGQLPDISFYRMLVNAYDGKAQYEEAIAQFPLIIKILEKSKDPSDKSRLAANQGWLLFRSGEFTQSIEKFEEAKLLATEMNQQDVLADAYLGLGRVYYNLRDYPVEAINYQRFLDLADVEKDRHLVFFVLSRLGDIQRETGDFDEGIETYYKLVELAEKVGDSSRIANTLNRIAWGYYQQGDLEPSLEVYLKDLDISKQIDNKHLIVNCLGNIANIYRDWNYFEKAIEYYTLSIEESLKIGDVYNLTWLYKDISLMYANMERYELAYENFVLHSAYNDTLMSEDYGRRLVQAQSQYEAEKNASEMELLEMRLQRNNYLMYGLGGLSLLIIVIGFLFLRTSRLRSRQRLEDMNHKVSTLTQKNLRTQMNPHFIFNTLNSIQYYVFQNDKIASNNYMTKFAKLIRKTLENSEHPAIPISEEIDALKLYLELESLRFKQKFDWKIDIDDEIDTYMYKIPTMLIQPFVENAIGHGLMHKTGKGLIHVGMKLDKDVILCSIEDNGVGRKKAMEIKNNKEENHRSLGTSITESRLRLVNSLYGKNMKVNYTDLQDEKGEAVGTRVEISIPIIT